MSADRLGALVWGMKALGKRALMALILFVAMIAGAKGQDPTGISTTSALWVKVCSKPGANTAAQTQGKPQVCLQAHHERLDRQTGMVLVSVAIRKVETFDQPLLIVMVPLGMAIKPGLELRFDDQTEGKRIEFSTCHFAGCTGETIASDDLISKMKSGRKLTVTAVNQGGRQLLFPVPLDGFTKAYDGPAMDMAVYTKNRRELIKSLREPLYSLDRALPNKSASR